MLTSKSLKLVILMCIFCLTGITTGQAYTSKKFDGFQKAKGKTTYYVNAKTGNNHNAGTSPSSAWKSLDKVNLMIFKPGDKILFRSGTVYYGHLVIHGSGAPNHPVTVGKYGKGKKPRIEGQGRFKETILVYNVQYWNITELNISNKGEKRAPRRAGVRLVVNNFGTAHHIHLVDLYVHDVNGSNVKSKGGGAGITWSCRGDRIKSRFDDLLIADCHLTRTDRNGITGSSQFWHRNKWFPSLHVVIRNNLLEDIGGDGIVPIACDGALVEYNVIHGARRRAQDFAAGIWPWSCDSTIVQYNEVSGMKGFKDGMGYDSDWNCHNTIIQYNYSHDNDGGFLLVCDNGQVPDSISAGNTGTVVRYNISQNDGSRIVQMAGPVRNTKIYNNTFYVGKPIDVHLFLFNSWYGWSRDTYVYNNIFYVDGTGGFVHQSGERKENGKYVTSLGYGQSTGNVFANNVYYGHILNYPDKPENFMKNPLLVDPGSGKNGRSSLKGYQLRKNSPYRESGKNLKNNGGHDFWGNPVPADRKPSVGANQ